MIQNLDPQIVWKNFYALTQIPRPSKKEAQAVEYMYNWGKSHGLEQFLVVPDTAHKAINGDILRLGVTRYAADRLSEKALPVYLALARDYSVSTRDTTLIIHCP